MTLNDNITILIQFGALRILQILDLKMNFNGLFECSNVVQVEKQNLLITA